MSLIITNKHTLLNVALVTIKSKNIDLNSTTKGDLTIIKSGDEVVGINIQNYSKYFKAVEGAHTINKLQVEAITKLGYEIKDYESKFVIGEVTQRTVHPKSEKLFCLKVKTNKELNIVTNSLNSLVGTKVVVAQVGSTLPSGVAITLSKVLGVESQGMLCGGETLGMKKTEGILIPVGNIGEKFIL